MDIHDRGTMKWTSLMLPEHLEALNQIWNEVEQKEMPVLDEQQIAENNMKLQVALEYDKKIRIKYFADNDYVDIEGYLLGTDMINGVIIMEETEIRFDDVIAVELL